MQDLQPIVDWQEDVAELLVGQPLGACMLCRACSSIMSVAEHCLTRLLTSSWGCSYHTCFVALAAARFSHHVLFQLSSLGFAAFISFKQEFPAH